MNTGLPRGRGDPDVWIAGFRFRASAISHTSYLDRGLGAEGLEFKGWGGRGL